MTDHAIDAAPLPATDPADFCADDFAALLLNKSAILDALAEARITGVVVGFDEKEFTTDIEFIVVSAGETVCSLPRVPVQYARRGFRRRSVDLSRALNLILCDLLGTDRDYDAGAEGTLRIDVVARTIVLKGLQREIVHHPFKRIV